MGLRIRIPSSTKSQTDHENDVDFSPTTDSLIVREFCPGLNEYFVIFEDASSPPHWITLHNTSNLLKDDVQVVIDWDRESHPESLCGDDQSPCDFSDEDNDQDPDITMSNEFNDKHQTLDSNEIIDPITPTTNDETPSDSVPSEIGIGLVVTETTKSTKMCELCGERDEYVQDCPECGNHSYHPACMPSNKVDTRIHESWRCWHCICEFS